MIKDLFPEPGRIKVSFVFCMDEFGGVLLINSKFRGAHGRHWVYDAMDDHAEKKAVKLGRIYKFVGHCVAYKNDTRRMVGKTTVVRVPL